MFFLLLIPKVTPKLWWKRSQTTTHRQNRFIFPCSKPTIAHCSHQSWTQQRERFIHKKSLVIMWEHKLSGETSVALQGPPAAFRITGGSISSKLGRISCFDGRCEVVTCAVATPLSEHRWGRVRRQFFRICEAGGGVPSTTTSHKFPESNYYCTGNLIKYKHSCWCLWIIGIWESQETFDVSECQTL